LFSRETEFGVEGSSTSRRQPARRSHTCSPMTSPKAACSASFGYFAQLPDRRKRRVSASIPACTWPIPYNFSTGSRRQKVSLAGATMRNPRGLQPRRDGRHHFVRAAPTETLKPVASKISSAAAAGFPENPDTAAPSLQSPGKNHPAPQFPRGRIRFQNPPHALAKSRSASYCPARRWPFGQTRNASRKLIAVRTPQKFCFVARRSHAAATHQPRASPRRRIQHLLDRREKRVPHPRARCWKF